MKLPLIILGEMIDGIHIFLSDRWSTCNCGNSWLYHF